jgi:hypothetical protein
VDHLMMLLQSSGSFVTELLVPNLLQHGRHIMSISAFQLGMYHFVTPGERIFVQGC